MVVVSLDRAVGFPLPAVITAASLKNPLGLSGGVLIEGGLDKKAHFRDLAALRGFLTNCRTNISRPPFDPEERAGSNGGLKIFARQFFFVSFFGWHAIPHISAVAMAVAMAVTT